MVKEIQNQPPKEDISDLELKPLAEVKDEDKEKQADYDLRMEGFMKGFEKLQKKYGIKLIQIPARIIYFDQKNADNN
jgi:hypothetical protein